MKKLVTLFLIPVLINTSFAKTKKTSKSPAYNIRELALPSEVEGMSKKAGSIYYSPSVKGKVLIPIHIWGQVKNSGLHFMPVDTNLINGISLAGGPGTSAKLDEVYVSTSRSGKKEKLEFDLSEGGQLEMEDFRLQPGDTVFIPQDTFTQDRAYYTSLVGVVLTVLTSILLYRQVRN